MKKTKNWSNWAALVAVCSLALAGTAAAQSRGGARNNEARETRGSSERVEQSPGEQRGVINLNTATADELQRLPGIGPSKAQAILATRQRMGRFARVEDVLRVRGIGRATLRRLQPMLSVEGPTTLSEAPRAGRTRTAAAQQ